MALLSDLIAKKKRDTLEPLQVLVDIAQNVLNTDKEYYFPDGSVATSQTMVVNEDRLNNRRTTLIPSVADNRLLSKDEAIKRALDSGEDYPTYDTIQEGITASKWLSKNILSKQRKQFPFDELLNAPDIEDILQLDNRSDAKVWDPVKGDYVVEEKISLNPKVPEYLQFPEFYGISQEELAERPDVNPDVTNSAPTLSQLNNPNEMARWHQNEKKKHEERTFIPRMAIDYVTQTNPEIIEQWKAMKPRGFGEQFTENPQYKVPFIGSVFEVADDLSVMGAMERLRTDQYEDVTSRPHFNSTSGLSGMPIYLDFKTTTAETQRESDNKILGTWMLAKAQNAVRGQTIGGQIGAGTSAMPKFMLEYMATGGGARIVQTSMKRVMRKIIDSRIKGAAGRILRKGVPPIPFTAGALARTAQMPHMIASETTGELLNATDVRLTDKGIEVNRNITPTKALLRASATTFIEMFSESTGKTLGKIVPNRVRKAFEEAFTSKNPNSKVSKLWTKGGFDGFIKEMGEEEIAEIMRVGFGLDSIAQYKNNKTYENYLVKSGIISSVGGVGQVTGALGRIPRRKRNEPSDQTSEYREVLNELEENRKDLDNQDVSPDAGTEAFEEVPTVVEESVEGQERAEVTTGKVSAGESTKSENVGDVITDSRNPEGFKTVRGGTKKSNRLKGLVHTVDGFDNSLSSEDNHGKPMTMTVSTDNEGNVKSIALKEAGDTTAFGGGQVLDEVKLNINTQMDALLDYVDGLFSIEKPESYAEFEAQLALDKGKKEERRKKVDDFFEPDKQEETPPVKDQERAEVEEAEEIEDFSHQPEKEFARSIGVDPDSLSYLGEGDNGTAYETEDGRVIKVTSSDEEADIAYKLIGKKGSHAEIYDVKVVNGEYVIYQELLEQDQEIEHNFQRVQELLDSQGLPIQLLDNLDRDDLSPEQQETYDELEDFILGIENINRTYRKLGIEASDVRPENIGTDAEGTLKAFDLDNKDKDSSSKDIGKDISVLKSLDPKAKQEETPPVEDQERAEVEEETEQAITSAKTSRSQVPAIFSKIPWIKDQRNIDLGGGKYDKGSEFLLEKHGVTNVVYDPFNRPDDHNDKVAKEMAKGEFKTATLANVLNVIKEPEHRLELLKQAHSALEDGGVLYINVHEGSGSSKASGIGKKTATDSWQNNRVLKDYLHEVQQIFPEAIIKGNMIIATKESTEASTPKKEPTSRKPDPQETKPKGVTRLDDPKLKPKPVRKKRPEKEPLVRKKKPKKKEPKLKKAKPIKARERRKSTKRVVLENTGQVDLSKKRSFSETQLIKMKLGAEQRASIKAFTSGVRKSVNNIKDALEFIRKVLPPELREKAIKAATNIDTKNGQQKLYDTINRIIEQAKPSTKRTIRQSTGIEDTSKKNEMSEKALLKLRLGAEERGSLKGFKAGVLDAKASLKEAIAFVKKHLPKEVQNKALPVLQGAVDGKGVDKVVEAVNRIYASYAHRQAVLGLKEAIKKVSGKNANKLLPEIRAQVEDLLDGTRLTKPSSKALKALEGLAKSIEAEGLAKTTEGDPMSHNQPFIAATIEKMRNAAKLPIRELPTQSILDLTEAINILIKQNQDKGLMRSLKGAIKFKNVVKAIVASLGKQKSLDKNEGKDRATKKGFLSKFWQDQMRPKLLANMIDNSEDGLATELFHHAPDIALEQINRENDKAIDRLRKAAEKTGVGWETKALQHWSKVDSGKTIFRKEKADVREIELFLPKKEGKKFGFFRDKRRKIKLSRAELIHLNLTLRDLGNQKKALSDGLEMFGNELQGETIYISIEDIETLDNEMTPQERVFAETIFNYFQTEGKEKLAAIEAQEGGSITLIDNYFPRSVSKAKTQQFGGDIIEALNNVLSISSYRKERIENKHPIVIKDAFQVYLEHASQLNTDLYMRPVAKDMLAVLGNDKVANQMARVYGVGLKENLQERVFDLMQMNKPKFSALDKLYTAYLRKWSMSTLGLRLSTILKQTGGLFPAASELSVGVFRSYVSQLANAAEYKKMSQEMEESNATLKDRYDMNAIHLSTGVFMDKRMMLGRKGTFDWTLSPLQRGDKRVAVAAYTDAKRLINESKTDLTEADLITESGRKTEQVVADTQNTTSIANMSKLARDSKRSALLRSTTLFMSNAESMVNLLRTSAWRVRASKLDRDIAEKNLAEAKKQGEPTAELEKEVAILDKKVSKDRKQMSSTFAAVMIGNAGTAIAVNKAMGIGRALVISAIGGGDDKLEEELDMEKFLLELPKKFAMENVGNVYHVGKLARAIESGFAGEPWWKNNLLGPLGTNAGGGIRSGILMRDAIDSGLGTPKGKAKSAESLVEAADALAKILGAPSFVITETGRPIIKLMKGSSGSDVLTPAKPETPKLLKPLQQLRQK